MFFDNKGKLLVDAHNCFEKSTEQDTTLFTVIKDIRRQAYKNNICLYKSGIIGDAKDCRPSPWTKRKNLMYHSQFFKF